MLSNQITICLLTASAMAAIPQLTGYHVVWSDDFNGNQGLAVDQSSWYYMTGIGNSNGEVQQYTDDPNNAHLSGDGQLYIIPYKTGNQWTSARLETTSAWGCPENKAMVFQADLRIPDFTTQPAKYDGLWPSFWTKGVSNRNGVGWPKCGEWDIFECSNRMSNRNQGTLHFEGANGNHNGAFQGSVFYEGGDYHTWALKVDRRGGNWQTDSLSWWMDGEEFYRVYGSDVGTLEQWKELAWQPYFIILQMAIGGGYPGSPTANTVAGFESSLRVKYAAVYESN